MADLVRHAAAPAVPGEKVAHAISRAAHRLGFTRGRTESFWYGKALPGPEELERAREEATKRAKDRELLRNEFRRAVDILARIEARLTRTDEDFYSPEIGALRDMARGADRARGPGGE
jgi:hypothetical protein